MSKAEVPSDLGIRLHHLETMGEKKASVCLQMQDTSIQWKYVHSKANPASAVFEASDSASCSDDEQPCDPARTDSVQAEDASTTNHRPSASSSKLQDNGDVENHERLEKRTVVVNNMNLNL